MTYYFDFDAAMGNPPFASTGNNDDWGGGGNVRTHAGRRDLHRVWQSTLRGDAARQPAMGWRRCATCAGVMVAQAVEVGAIVAMRLLAVLAVLWAVAMLWYIVEAGFVTLPVP